jgi:hypothetical protein
MARRKTLILSQLRQRIQPLFSLQNLTFFSLWQHSPLPPPLTLLGVEEREKRIRRGKTEKLMKIDNNATLVIINTLLTVPYKVKIIQAELIYLYSSCTHVHQAIFVNVYYETGTIH